MDRRAVGCVQFFCCVDIYMSGENICSERLQSFFVLPLSATVCVTSFHGRERGGGGRGAGEGRREGGGELVGVWRGEERGGRGVGAEEEK